MTPEAYSALLTSIADILIDNGIKATSMDYIAASLHISKRTLYEIFGNKTHMVTQALISFHQRMCREHTEIYNTTENVLEAALLSFRKQRDFLSRVNVDFFKDRDSVFAEVKFRSTQSKQDFVDNIAAILNKGVEQGLFRSDLNLALNCKLMLVVMESLKRMEEFFPPEVTLIDAYDATSIGFLRSIATVEGHKMLDQMITKISDKTITDK